MADKELDIKDTAVTKKNRRITFTIIKRLWKLRGDGKDNNIYSFYLREVIPMVTLSRASYDDILGGTATLSKNLVRKLDKMAECSGIAPEYFYGTKQVCVPSIGDSEWDKYFKDKEALTGSKDAANMAKQAIAKLKTAVKEFEGKLTGVLREIKSNFGLNTDDETYVLYQMYCYYTLDVIAAGKSKEVISNICIALQNIKFTDIAQADNAQLEQYIGHLKKQLDMADTTWRYKKYSLEK